MTGPSERDPQAEQDHAAWRGWMEANAYSTHPDDCDGMAEAFAAGSRSTDVEAGLITAGQKALSADQGLAERDPPADQDHAEFTGWFEAQGYPSPEDRYDGDEMGEAFTAGMQAQRDLDAATEGRPRIVCLCGSTRFYAEFQQANYDLTMRGEIVLSVGFYPHAKAEHGHGEGVGHDSAEKGALDELHKRKIDLADYVHVVSDDSGYFGQSTAGEIAYAVAHGKPVRFAEDAARERALAARLVTDALADARGRQS